MILQKYLVRLRYNRTTRLVRVAMYSLIELLKQFPPRAAALHQRWNTQTTIGLRVSAAVMVVATVIIIVLLLDRAFSDVRLPLVLLTSVLFLVTGVISFLAVAVWKTQSVSESAHTLNLEDANKLTLELREQVASLEDRVKGLLESHDNRSVQLLDALTSLSQDRQETVSEGLSVTEVVHTLNPEDADRLTMELTREVARLGSEVRGLLESHDKRSIQLLRALAAAEESRVASEDATEPTEARRRPETLGPARPKVGPRGT